MDYECIQHKTAYLLCIQLKLSEFRSRIREKIDGTGDGTRTRKLLKARDFKSLVSTDSTTPASSSDAQQIETLLHCASVWPK